MKSFLIKTLACCTFVFLLFALIGDPKKQIPEPYYLEPFTDDGYTYAFGKERGTRTSLNNQPLPLGLIGIVDYYTTDGYILLLNMPVYIDPVKTSYSYTDRKDFYAVSYRTGEYVGPMTEDEFNVFLKSKNIKNPNLTVPKHYIERSAIYRRKPLDCEPVNPIRLCSKE